MKKTIIAVSVLCAVLMGITGCSKSGEKKIKIGIIQLVEHPALDKNYQGWGCLNIRALLTGKY